jgi:hypothetical protein
MENKSYTILIASNQQGETFKLNISNRLFRFLIVLGFLAIVLVMTVAYDYFGLLLKANENRFLKVENSTLKSQFQSAEERLSSLEASLERIQTFTKKLNLITNTEDDERVLKLGLSPSSHNAGNVADAQAAVSRLPSSEFMIRDPQNLDKPFVDEKSGEMGVARESARDYATLSVRIDRDLRQSQMREQGVLQLWGALSERQGLLNSTPSIKPTR